MDDSERIAILSAAKDAGLSGESAALLDEWRAARPGYKVLSAWKDYVSELASTMDETAKDKLKHELLGRSRTVAESAGGFLSIGKISIDGYTARALKRAQKSIVQPFFSGFLRRKRASGPHRIEQRSGADDVHH